jgi:nitrilase
VVVACGLLQTEVIPEDWRADIPPGGQIADGGSAIIAPDGAYIAGPVYEEETIVYGELGLSQVASAKRLVDVAGHYSRPDVVRLLFDQSPHSPLVKPEGPAQELGPSSEQEPRRSTRRRPRRRRPPE